MFNILDIVLIVFILLCVGIGAYRGFIGSVAKLLGGLLRLVVSILLARPLVKLISLTKLDEHLFDKLYLNFSGLSEKFNVNLVGMEQADLDLFVESALTEAKIPKIFRGLFTNIFDITPEVIASKESVTIAELMGVTVTNIILLVGAFIALMLILWILSKLIMRWSKRVSKSDTVFAKTNKWLGAVFGLVKSFLIVFILFIVVSFVSDFQFMAGAVQYINSSFIGGWMYKISQMLINSSFDLKAMLQNWLVK